MPELPFDTGANPSDFARSVDEYVALSAHHLVRGGAQLWKGAGRFALRQREFERARGEFLADPPRDSVVGLARARKEPYRTTNHAIYAAWGDTWPDEVLWLLAEATELDKDKRRDVCATLQRVHTSPEVLRPIHDAASRLRKTVRARLPTRAQLDFLAQVLSDGPERLVRADPAGTMLPQLVVDTGFDVDPSALLRLSSFLHDRLDADVWLVGFGPPEPPEKRSWETLWRGTTRQGLPVMTKLTLSLYFHLYQDRTLLPDQTIRHKSAYNEHVKEIRAAQRDLSDEAVDEAALSRCREQGRPILKPVTDLVARLMRCTFANLRASPTPASVRAAVERSYEMDPSRSE